MFRYRLQRMINVRPNSPLGIPSTGSRSDTSNNKRLATSPHSMLVSFLLFRSVALRRSRVRIDIRMTWQATNLTFEQRN